MGRPKKEPTSVVRLPSALLDAAEKWATKLDEPVTRSEAVSRILREYLKQRKLL